MTNEVVELKETVKTIEIACINELCHARFLLIGMYIALYVSCQRNSWDMHNA